MFIVYGVDFWAYMFTSHAYRCSSVVLVHVDSSVEYVGYSFNDTGNERDQSQVG